MDSVDVITGAGSGIGRAPAVLERAGERRFSDKTGACVGMRASFS